MNNIYLPDNLIQELIELFETGDIDRIALRINELKDSNPADERVHYFEYTLLMSTGNTSEALNALWSCLEIKPKEVLFLGELKRTILQQDGNERPILHDLRLKSGERQTASSIEKIRTDHTVRYKWAAKILKEIYPSSSGLTGLDLFCGNGYGSKIINSMTGARMVGIDGSEDAVAQANHHYGNHRTAFINNYFPFELNFKNFGFITCFESIEHTPHYQALINQIFSSTSGPLFISVPAEETLPFQINKNFFKFHHKHFTLDEIQACCSQQETHELAGVYGQSTYTTSNQKVTGTIPAEEMYIKPGAKSNQFHILHYAPRDTH